MAAVGAAAAWAAVAAAPGDDTGAAQKRPTKEQAKACREAHQAGQEPTEECKQLRQKAARRGPKASRPGAPALNHAIHGDLIVKNKDGEFETVTFDKGIVQAKGDKSLTLKREDGKTVTVKVNDDTKYRGVDGFDGVQTGQPAIVVSADGTARSVAQRAPGGNNRRRGNVKSNEEQVPAT